MNMLKNTKSSQIMWCTIRINNKHIVRLDTIEIKLTNKAKYRTGSYTFNPLSIYELRIHIHLVYLFKNLTIQHT